MIDFEVFNKVIKSYSNFYTKFLILYNEILNRKKLIVFSSSKSIIDIIIFISLIDLYLLSSLL